MILFLFSQDALVNLAKLKNVELDDCEINKALNQLKNEKEGTMLLHDSSIIMRIS